ncbi:MAG: VCBS repeat-containing protein, partial [Planctomycetes bacterium]|nr:VCBS repeat-containing protein [Planctomycetota bacterium]
NKIAWYENTNGLGSFGPQQVISTAADGPRCVFSADLDGDGDTDVLSASDLDGTIAWYENDPVGSGDFDAERVVTTQADAPRCVLAADLDGDGDRDVLSASSNDDEIAWSANTDGLGNFGPRQVISAAADGAWRALAADLDGDGDLDVLSASANDDEIAWYDNTNGLGGFGPQQLISNVANGAWCAFAADLDGDSDEDVLSASANDDKIAWYENTNGLGAFGPQQVISMLADGARSVFAVDLDGDGDVDVLSASSNDDTIAWYENTNGLGSFGPQRVISTAADYALCVFAADLDGDADADALSASYNDDEVAWYENVDGLGSFGPQRVISTAADCPVSVFASDLDGDGDQDVLCASYNDDEIAWYENTDGLGSFGPQHRISTLADGAWHVSAADLDGDGDPDALSASLQDDKIAWYRNLMGVAQADMGYGGPGQVEILVWGQALSSGQAATFDLSGAPPHALTILLVSPSFTPTYVWEVGGYLCPILPPLALMAAATDGDGAVDLPGAVPGGSGPASIYVQAACQDPGQPMGFAVSNCVRIDLLP